jgi:hypothetical protein
MRRELRTYIDGPDHAHVEQVAETPWVKQLAEMLTATPSARAKLFANPSRYIVKNLPSRRYWRYTDKSYRWHRLRKWLEERNARKSLAQALLLRVAEQVENKELASTVNTDAVYEESFAPIVRVSQHSFTSVFVLSAAAFVAGLGLIGSGVYIAIFPPSTGNSTVLASIFGASGAISALGAIYAMATTGIRDATLDHARLAMVMTRAATQLGPLRALAEAVPPSSSSQLEMVTAINDAVTHVMDGALDQIPMVVTQGATTSSPPKSRNPISRRGSSKVRVSPGGKPSGRTAGPDDPQGDPEENKPDP